MTKFIALFAILLLVVVVDADKNIRQRRSAVKGVSTRILQDNNDQDGNVTFTANFTDRKGKRNRDDSNDGDDLPKAKFDFPIFGEFEGIASREQFLALMKSVESLNDPNTDLQSLPSFFKQGESSIVMGLVQQVLGCTASGPTNTQPTSIIIEQVLQTLRGVLNTISPECSAYNPMKESSQDLIWTFNYAGMVTASYALLYASPVEYILVFGSPIPTHGTSGRYTDFNVTDTIIQGKLLNYRPGDLDPTEFRVCEFTNLESGDATAYALPESTFMIEHGMGNIRGVLDYGVTFPTYYTTLDFESAVKTVRDQVDLNERWGGWLQCIARQS